MADGQELIDVTTLIKPKKESLVDVNSLIKTSEPADKPIEQPAPQQEPVKPEQPNGFALDMANFKQPDIKWAVKSLDKPPPPTPDNAYSVTTTDTNTPATGYKQSANKLFVAPPDHVQHVNDVKEALFDAVIKEKPNQKLFVNSIFLKDNALGDENIEGNNNEKIKVGDGLRDDLVKDLQKRYPQYSKDIEAYADELGQRRDAIRKDLAAVHLNTGDVNSMYDLGTQYLGLGDTDKAETTFKGVLSMQPDNTNAMQGLAYISKKKGDLATSDMLYTKVAQANPSSENLSNVALSKTALGQFDLAQQITQQAIAKDPQNSHALRVQGLAKSLSGDVQGGIDDTNKGVDIDKLNQQGYDNAILDSNGNIRHVTKAQQDLASLSESMLAFGDKLEQTVELANTGAKALIPEYAIASAVYEGIKGTADKLHEVAAEYGKDGVTLITASGTASAIVSGVFTAATALSKPMQQFVVTMAKLDAVLPSDLLAPVLAPVSTAVSWFNNDPSKTTLNVAGLLDVPASLVLFHYAGKGMKGKGEKAYTLDREKIETIAQKIRENKPLTRDEAQITVDAFRDMTPADAIAMQHNIAQNDGLNTEAGKVKESVEATDPNRAPMEKINELASRIIKGEKVDSPEDLQLQSNYGKELEKEIKRLSTPFVTVEAHIIKTEPVEPSPVVELNPENTSSGTQEKPEPKMMKVLGKEIPFYENYLPDKDNVEKDATYSFTANSKSELPELLQDNARMSSKGTTTLKDGTVIKNENWHSSISGEELTKLYEKGVKQEGSANPQDTPTTETQKDANAVAAKPSEQLSGSTPEASQSEAPPLTSEAGKAVAEPAASEIVQKAIAVEESDGLKEIRYNKYDLSKEDLAKEVENYKLDSGVGLNKYKNQLKAKKANLTTFKNKRIAEKTGVYDDEIALAQETVNVMQQVVDFAENKSKVDPLVQSMMDKADDRMVGAIVDRVIIKGMEVHEAIHDALKKNRENLDESRRESIINKAKAELKERLKDDVSTTENDNIATPLEEQNIGKSEQNKETPIEKKGETESGAGEKGVTEPKQSDTVELPPAREGGQPRTMVYDEGQWKQKVGRQLSEVGKSLQNQAHQEFLNKSNINQEGGQNAISKQSPERMGAHTGGDKSVGGQGEGKGVGEVNKLQETAGESDQPQSTSTRGNVSSEKQAAKERLEKARQAFKAARGNLSFGGLSAMPEFVELVKAHVANGIVDVKEFIKSFRELDPDAKETDRDISDAFDAAQDKLSKGITKEELKSDWKKIGVDEEFGKSLKQDFPTLAEGAREKIESGKVNADDLAQGYADGSIKAVSDENLAILLTRKRQLQNLIEDLNTQRETATPEQLSEINSASAAIQAKYETILKGTNKATTIAGKALNSVKMALEKDYSLAAMKAQIANIKGSKLTDAEIKVIEDLQKEIAEKTKIIEDYEKERLERDKKQQAEAQKAELERLNKSAELEKKRDKRANTKEELKKERDSLFTRLNKIAKEQANTLSANPIPLKMIPVLSKLAKNYIKDGALTTEQWIADIHAKLSPSLAGLTIDHVKESLFGKRQKPALDRAELAKRAEVKKAQDKFNNLKKKYQLTQRSGPEKIRDAMLKWQRFAILSGVKTLGKLSAAATARQFLTSTTEEAIGWGIGKALPKLAKDAPREGGYNFKAEAANITEAFKKATYKDIWQTAKTGKGELDLVFGKEQLPPEALDFFGHLHGALKTMPKRGEFFRAFEKRMEHAIRNGADGTDPLVQAEIGAKAYEDAMRTIFMNENNVVSAYNGFLSILENKGSKGAAATLRFLLPIVKIPSNFFAESTSYLGGGLKAAAVLRKGIENLTPEQKDYVLRNLKKQTLGATLLAIGYFNADNIGGYYQQGEKRKKEDAQLGNVKMLGVEIPHLFLHAPALEMLQFGATIKRIQDAYVKKHKDNPLASGVGGAIWGLAEQQPFVGEASQTITDVKDKGAAYLPADLAKGFLLPRLVQEFAGGLDKEDLDAYKFFFGEARKRERKGVVANFQEGIPILREKLPLKKK